jgi:hypothetical protein
MREIHPDRCPVCYERCAVKDGHEHCDDCAAVVARISEDDTAGKFTRGEINSLKKLEYLGREIEPPILTVPTPTADKPEKINWKKERKRLARRK